MNWLTSFAAVELSWLVMNKLIYIRQAVLDLSKILMYGFYYDYALPKWGSNYKLMYMDTDSFLSQIFTKDFYADMVDDVDEWSDMSNYSPTTPITLLMSRNKKVIGKMKDEMRGCMITDLVPLRSKSYAYKMHDGSQGKKCKEVKCDQGHEL